MEHAKLFLADKQRNYDESIVEQIGETLRVKGY